MADGRSARAVEQNDASLAAKVFCSGVGTRVIGPRR